jgi:hypothetical protein
MQFRHPEVFYFLILLIIPILVHLFQLQKFKKVAFTNVAFLKKISLETRKSSRLKKWLILATRLLGLLALLFVFSQPYLSDKKSDEKNHNVIYIDNSLSLNTNGNKGNELRIAAQEIIENSGEFDSYTLLTNDQTFENIDKTELDDALKNLEFSSKSGNLSQVLLEVESRKNNQTNTLYKNILISDFQKTTENKENLFTNVKNEFSIVQIDQNQRSNLSIDSLYIANSNAEEILISAVIKNQGESKENVSIALYNDEQLVNKRSFSIDRDTNETLEFSVAKTSNFKGKIQITFNDVFLFDNSFFFNISSQSKTHILSIGKPSDALSRIFAEDGFNYSNSLLQNVNYNAISEQQLIVLNELQTIPNVLQTTLVQFLENGGHLLIIPNEKLEVNSYNSFFRKFNSGQLTGMRSDSLKITGINFDHPLYSNVFSKKVDNFQYPSVTKSYQTNLSGNAIIRFENRSAFLQEIKNPFSKIYWFSSPLSSEVTNFSNSPLIVPTIYNIAQQSLEVSKPYYTLQKQNSIEINKKVGKDEILTLSNNTESFIPLQQSFANKVRLTTQEQPKEAGFYKIALKKDTLETVAYNLPKEESLLSFYNINKLESENPNVKVYDSIASLFDEINEKNEVRWLWKLFLVLAIVSLLAEIFILKFFKT